MLITIDVGNTHTVIGIYEGERLTHHWRLSTEPDRTTDEYGVTLQGLLSGAGLESSLKPEGVVIACVVPPLNQAHRGTRRNSTFIARPHRRSRNQDRDADSYENPKEVGADRIVKPSPPTTPFQRLHRGRFRYCHDLRLHHRPRRVRWRRDRARTGYSMDALVEHAAKLYRVELVRPSETVGRTTVGAIQSGLVFGYTRW